MGALLLAGQMFDQQPQAGHKTLVIYSDMRNSTSELNLEGTKVVPTISTNNGHRIPTASLTGVQVFVFGVDGAGKSTTLWQGLHAFWVEYFHASGTRLTQYTLLR
jgi:hypothetical protein